jgi:hypothetical protein
MSMTPLAPLSCAAVVLLLAGCSSPDPGEDMLGAGGSTLQVIRGMPADPAPLKPEQGNIWEEGLQGSPALPKP